MGIASELSELKTASDTLMSNKVSRFAYTQQAYEDDDADGVTVYNVNQEQNIPVGTPSVMKVNDTVVEKGWRARASSITRMLMNHFLGRISYNLNKVNDWFNTLLADLSASLGTADGIATLDDNGHVPYTQLPSLVRTINNLAPNAQGERSIVLGENIPVTAKMIGSIMFNTTLSVFTLCSYPENTHYTGGAPRRIVEFKGLWVAGWYISQGGGTPYTKGIVYSEDYGKTWQIGLNNTGSYDLYASEDICIASGANSGATYYSEDGKTWTEMLNPMVWYTKTHSSLASYNYFTDEDVQSICYHKDKDIWVAISHSSATGASGAWWSENGIDWAKEDDFSVSRSVLAYNDNIFLVASTDSNYGIRWSEDGKNWTLSNAPSNYVLGRPIYSKKLDLWVASFAGEGIYWSSDGKVWTQGTCTNASFATSTIKYLDYSKETDVFLGLADNVGGFVSTDGKVWILSSYIPQSSPFYYLKSIFNRFIYTTDSSGYKTYYTLSSRGLTGLTTPEQLNLTNVSTTYSYLLNIKRIGDRYFGWGSEGGTPLGYSFDLFTWYKFTVTGANIFCDSVRMMIGSLTCTKTVEELVEEGDLDLGAVSIINPQE